MTDKQGTLVCDFMNTVDGIADRMGEIDIKYLERFRPFVQNWDTLEAAVKEDNEQGWSKKWNDIVLVAQGTSI